MADDINLPNLVSHLAVNLDGVSGAIGDASRQGSAMGSALGNGIHRELDDLLRNLPQVTIDGDSEPLDRDLARVHQQLAQLDAQRIGVDIAIPDALRQLEELETQLQRIGDEHPSVNVRAAVAAASRQLAELRAAARQVDDTDVDIDVDVDEDGPNRLHGLLGRVARMGAQAGASIAGGLARGGAALGAVIPAAAAVVTTLENVAPAAAVAVTGMAAVQLASGAVKLAAVGMDDALSAALDPSKAEDYAEALKKLSPEARKFAEAVHEAQPALHALQQDVQDRVFDGLAASLERTGRSVLPVLRTALLSTAGALNTMGQGVLGAGKELADSGVLGQALGSASKGLHNLANVPGIVVTALGQIGAAAGPSFERLTNGASDVAVEIGNKLGAAFESGAMERAIDHAIDLLGQLVDVGGNVGSIIGSIFNAVPPGGGGLIGILQDVTGAIADIAASDGVQDALRALFSVMGTLGSTVAPLLAQALGAIAPVITALGPPAEHLIEALGEGLSPVIDALGPVLVAAAGAVGALVEAAAPLLPVIGELAAALLPALTPLLQACQEVFEALAPVVGEVASILLETLSPVLDALPGIIEPLASILADRLVFFLQLLGEILIALAPSLVQLGESFGEILVAAAPLLDALAQLVAELLTALMPILTPLIGLIGQLAAILANQLAGFITNVVVPALQFVAALLRGDFSGAAEIAKKAALNLVTLTVSAFAAMPGQIGSALAGLASILQQRMIEATGRLLSAAASGIARAVSEVAQLPSRARSVLGNLNGTLFAAGASLIAGFVAGIVSKIPSISSVLSDITSMIPKKKGPPSKDAKLLTPAGRLLIEGFIRGIDESTAKLRTKLESITKALPSNVKSGIGKTLKKATDELRKEITARDAVLKDLAAAQKKLAALRKEGAKESKDITEGILRDANIVSGNAQVNSVNAITIGLQTQLAKTRQFQADIEKLKKAGLRSDLLQQIADAGVDAGAATASALAKATPAELKKINDLQGQLASSATATGKTVGDALYTAGIRAAEGLVRGLQSQEKKIEQTMERIAKGMLTTVKKAHDSHSPSREFEKLGIFGGLGLERGFLSMGKRVRDAARSVAQSSLDIATTASRGLAFTPSGPQLAAVYGGASGGGDQTNVFNLYGSEASPDGILRALSWRGMVGRAS